MKVIPKKNLGQNFIINREVIYKIIKSILPRKKEFFIEIGPGTGAITHELINRTENLVAIEIDTRLGNFLASKYKKASNFKILNNSILKVNLEKFGKNLRIVGNLPYNMSTEILFYLTNHSNLIKDCSLMLQKEFVDRMVARPDTSHYGRLSVMMQSRWNIKKIFDIDPLSFNPVPKVDSTFISMMVKKDSVIPDGSSKIFSFIVKTAFQYRRKKIRNSLKKIFKEEELSNLGIDTNLRAENLKIEDYAEMAQYKKLSS